MILIDSRAQNDIALFKACRFEEKIKLKVEK